MPEIPLYSMNGQTIGNINISEDVFAAKINEGLIHQALLRQLANMRRGTHSTKTRGEVSGGGRKPWRQKGTGRARHGSTRSPLWRSGGITFGPKPRDYSQDMPKKMRKLALCGVLSSKVVEDKMIALDTLQFDEPKTKQFVEMLTNIKLPQDVLIIISANDKNVERSAANIPGVKVVTPDTINVFDIVKHDRLVMTKDSIACIEEALA